MLPTAPASRITNRIMDLDNHGVQNTEKFKHVVWRNVKSSILFTLKYKYRFRILL